VSRTPASDLWPATLWLVRHGESAGNIAREAAMAAGHLTVDVDIRDVDVPLSPRGELQAAALGRWFATMPRGQRPSVILTSPYARAERTASLLNLPVPIVTDERLREKEFGILDGLTWDGVAARHPEQAALRERLGKFYFRSPGGESWSDVILRLRTIMDTITREYGGERLLVVSHQVVVLCFRYILERLSETEILDIDRDVEVANCSVTTYAFDPSHGVRGGLALREFNFVAPLEDAGVTVTSAP
jgi:2,3-bisphosphoglycerate-dependent phosphoglycerate mutase